MKRSILMLLLAGCSVAGNGANIGEPMFADGKADSPGGDAGAASSSATGEATGPTGPSGPAGPMGGLTAVDANGTVLGAVMFATPYQIVYRDANGLSWNWSWLSDSTTILDTTAHLNGTRVWFANSDCTGTAWAESGLHDVAVIIGNQLYKTVGPITPATVQSVAAAPCSAQSEPSNFNLMAVQLVGPAPPAPALPIDLR